MQRILTATVLILAVAALLWFGNHYPWLLLLAGSLVALLAGFEYTSLVNLSGAKIPHWWTGIAILTFFAATFFRPDLQLPVLTLLAFSLFVISLFAEPTARVLKDAAAGAFGLLYIAWPLSLLYLLAAQSTGLLIFLFVCVWSGDIAALYIGRAIGGKKLAPSISPGKTWSGSIASVVASVLLGLLLTWFGQWLAARGQSILDVGLSLLQVPLFAALINVAAQIGDLLESAIKRGAGVKDSGNLLPGHGGILDRIDALLFAAPVLYYALLLQSF